MLADLFDLFDYQEQSAETVQGFLATQGLRMDGLSADRDRCVLSIGRS